MTEASHPPSCWVISDGAAGNERQVLALANSLQLSPRLLRIQLAIPWRWLAPRFVLGAQTAIRDIGGIPLQPPWPDIAIGCGRQAALVTRLLREWSNRHCFTVQILDPRLDPAHFDLVIAPQHDGITGANVIHTIGALNPVNADWLADGYTHFRELAELPTPRTTVLIGASNRAQHIDSAYLNALMKRLAAWHATDGGSFLVSASRRTPFALSAQLRKDFAHFPGRFWADPQDGENPYAGFLSYADRIVVTPDSVNMISEACATGKPAYTFAPRPIAGKLAAFHAELYASGHLRRLDNGAHPSLPLPLLETPGVAELVQLRWNKARD